MEDSRARGRTGTGPCDADDAPVLMQVALRHPADEPAFWDLRQAHRPYLIVSCASPTVAHVCCGEFGVVELGDQQSMVVQGAERASPCAESVCLFYFM